MFVRARPHSPEVHVCNGAATPSGMQQGIIQPQATLRIPANPAEQFRACWHGHVGGCQILAAKQLLGVLSDDDKCDEMPAINLAYRSSSVLSLLPCRRPVRRAEPVQGTQAQNRLDYYPTPMPAGVAPSLPPPRPLTPAAAGARWAQCRRQVCMLHFEHPCCKADFKLHVSSRVKAPGRLSSVAPACCAALHAVQCPLWPALRLLLAGTAALCDSSCAYGWN